MTKIAFVRDGWIEASLGDPGEESTFTRLTVRVGDDVLTRNFSKRSGGASNAINVPLFPLARTIAESWWSLLYEPLRAYPSDKFRARHRLDAAMHGYVFPALALCSAGDSSIYADWLSVRSDIAPVEFLTPSPPEPVVLERPQTELALMGLVVDVLARLPHGSEEFAKLDAAWKRVATSMNDPDELAYCVGAGRLGIDPYDADGPDFAAIVEGLSPQLANDVSEAVELSELQQTSDWIREVSPTLKDAPRVEVGLFGEPPKDILDRPAWANGRSAANELRSRLGLDPNRPRKAVQEILDGAVRPGWALPSEATSSIAALVSRRDGSARIGAVATSARQQRFRACAATYIAWFARALEERAATVALTRVQQASRAFAAELLAPRQLLAERAGKFGLTAEMIADIAKEFICPYDAVVLQAFNADIPMRGVEVPAFRRPALA